ncbi:MAG TPA: universal stress protein [Anaerolineales bacterium]|nr:universal stress protein [Anaerolineales bacterium]
MNANTLQLLLCTNGEPASYPALEYGTWLAGMMRLPVVLLGVLEKWQRQDRVKQMVDRAAGLLVENAIPHSVQFETGRGSIVISRLVVTGDFITVVGPLGRPTWRRVVQGRSFRRILSRVESPIFYVRENRARLEDILVCLGGLGYSTSVQNLCLHLAKTSNARVTLLHVVEPVSYRYPTSRDIVEHWQKIDETDTPQGLNLRRAKALFESAGLSVDLKIRHGSTVHEILEEVPRGKYDLIGLGSPYSTRSLRHVFLPNVTAEIAEAVNCPVLTVRYHSSTTAWETQIETNHDTQHNRK